MTVPEAGLDRTPEGLVPKGECWFVLNARESRWQDEGPLGLLCFFEGDVAFPAVRGQPERAGAAAADVHVPLGGRPGGLSRPLGREAVLRHGAGVREETTEPAVAYAPFPKRVAAAYREGTLPDLNASG